MEFRRAGREDIPALIEFRKQQLIDEGQKPDADITEGLEKYFTKQYEENSFVEWLAEDSGKIIGTAAICFIEFPPSFTNRSGIKGYVTNMYTVPECRGAGIATKMLELIIEEAKNREVSTVLLAASSKGAPVYQKSGFQKAEEWMKMDL